jgi:hypothetical protein
MQFGTRGAAGYQDQVDGVIVRNFTIYNSSSAGVRINSQNACDDSIFERGLFRNTSGNTAPLFDVQLSGLNFSIRNVSFGAPSTSAAINLAYPNTSGGQPIYIEACEFEVGSNPVIVASNADTSGGALILIGNAFGGSPLSITAQRMITSIGNFGSGTWTVSASTSMVTSVGDINPNPSTEGWQVSNGATLYRFTTYSSGALSAATFDASVQAALLISTNQASPAQQWQLVQYGASGSYPGCLALYDGTNSRLGLAVTPRGSIQLPYRATAGAPTSGTWSSGEIILDSNAVMYVCVSSGTPGTWQKVGSQ